MDILSPSGRPAEELSLEFIEYLQKEADGDPESLLRLLDAALEASRRHQGRLKALRLEAAKEMRDAGVPMKEIAKAANVNDSYLSRQILADGGTRRSDRTRQRRRRTRGIQAQGRTA